jgi:glycosidase
MFDVTRFWFDKGVDGFRLDMFHALYKDALFRDNPTSMKFMPDNFSGGYFQEWRYNLNQPETIQLAKELRALADSYQPERLLIGEIFGSDARMKEFVGQNYDGLNLVFLWDLMDMEPSAGFLRNVVTKYERLYPEPYTPMYVYGNHDRKRLFSRINQNRRLAALLACFQLTVRGVPVIYYGEEIGMAEVSIPASEANDPISQRYRWVPNFILDWLNVYPHRDGCRTPMQWEPGLNAGFCDRRSPTWLPVHKNHEQVNVQVELGDAESLLSIYRGLLNLRKENEALLEGSLEMVDTGGYKDQLLAYLRQIGSPKILVLLNFSGKRTNFSNNTNCDRVLFNVGGFELAGSGSIVIHPYSALILSNG